MNGTEHFNEAERLLMGETFDHLPDVLAAIGHALLALVKTEEEHSDEIVTMSASLAHLADDMSHGDDQGHVGGLTP